MQPAIRRSLNRGGKPYGVPTGAHRSNMLWFNIGLLTEGGRHAAGERLHRRRGSGDLGRSRHSGATALCLGGKDPFTTVELFENMLLGAIGRQGWKDMVADRLNWRSATGAVSAAIPSARCSPTPIRTRAR